MGIGSAFKAGYNSMKLPERKPMRIIKKKSAAKPTMAAAAGKDEEQPEYVEPTMSKGASLASHGAKGSSLKTHR